MIIIMEESEFTPQQRALCEKLIKINKRRNYTPFVAVPLIGFWAASLCYGVYVFYNLFK